MSKQAVTCPYNFVPLNEKIYIPDWKPSHDSPVCPEPLSGEIRYRLTAKTPILVAGAKKSKDDRNEVRTFCRDAQGRYFIPATTIKGMTRSLVEIMGFGRLSRFNDDTYAMARDIGGKSEYMELIRGARIGLLQKNGESMEIVDYGEPERIHQEAIAGFFKTPFYKLNKSQTKMAEEKYRVLGLKDNPLQNLQFAKVNGKWALVNADQGSTSGHLVLTGQPAPKKKLEFLLLESKRGKKLAVSPKVYQNFLFAYRYKEKDESTDLRFWLDYLDKGEAIPIFFKPKGEEVASMGISYLYKLPYRYSVRDSIPKVHTMMEKPDLAEAIFGYVREDGCALKGRVFFSACMAEGQPTTLPAASVILNSPKASYYPFYLEQEHLKRGKGEYITYQSEEPVCRGFKRYPVQKQVKDFKEIGENQQNVSTRIQPLEEGAVFCGTLRFHNLHPVELGALLAALAWNFEDERYHSLGMGKPLGLGRCELKIEHLKIVDYREEPCLVAKEPSACTQAFIAAMEKFLAGSKWRETPRMKELFAMATLQSPAVEKTLQYAELDDFKTYKETHRLLPPYSTPFQQPDITSRSAGSKGGKPKWAATEKFTHAPFAAAYKNRK
ncbi:TIGR03986 family CRISPR-associated RAMP protein [Desulfurispirillum indicum]|uniref:TIGR03986 family type III CRISPR-associated RAMP protein n=1 Tax=Desulfurispirillum indicum TaxID=936456 RepID=UPI001CFB5618|nr:TIGR03986 family CRISPR-associated RAMP protein [Desulfurispirillum indicum]UCZ57706.1 TIGR03986 family CRISPR-associated RAMP protein [Desulfurispirillum indicum]